MRLSIASLRSLIAPNHVLSMRGAKRRSNLLSETKGQKFKNYGENENYSQIRFPSGFPMRKEFQFLSNTVTWNYSQ